MIAVALDLDDFTLINDTHGHDTGDAVLIAVARRLSSATGGHATVARTGSDEFVVVADDITDSGSARAFVDQLRDALQQPIKFDGIELFVHARIGVTVDDASTSPESLLRSADASLARNNSAPVCRVLQADMRTRTNTRFALVNEPAPRALERNEFASLPADHPAVRRPGRRRRSADPLGPSGAKTGEPAEVRLWPRTPG